MYEEANFTSVQKHLKPGMLAYDIGAYNGETSVLIAQAVGAENVVIVEPSEVNWPNIEERWWAEVKGLPCATFPGFIEAIDKRHSDCEVYRKQFPPAAKGSLLPEDKLEFRWLHYRDEDPNVEARPRLSIDTLAAIVGFPHGIVMDVEGSELLALHGAVGVLEISHPHLWVSIHPEFMKERFNHTAGELHAFLVSLGYVGELLFDGHEQHFHFFAKESA